MRSYVHDLVASPAHRVCPRLVQSAKVPLGTVLGLIMTVSDLSVDKAQSFESFKAIITSIYVGAGIALYTNLLACIGYLWLGTNAHLLAREEV